MSVDTSMLADEIIRDLCEKPVPPLERMRLHDALSQFECELEGFMESHGYNLTRLAESIVDRPWEGPIADRMTALADRYGFEED